MVKFYLVLLLLAVLLLALPSTRRAVLNLGALLQGRLAPREAFHRATGAARRGTDAARTAGGTVVSSHVSRQLQTLAQTLVIRAPVDRVGPVLAEAVQEAAVLDPATPRPGEALAWTHVALGETRLAAVPDGAGSTVFGVVSFEYALRTPQGGSAVDQAMEKARARLTEHGLAFEVVSRDFEPGPTITADGPRTALPLG